MQQKRKIAAREAGEIGAAILRARKSLGLRQDELALAAGVSTRAIHQIEHGKPTSRLDSITPVLDVLGLRLRVEGRVPTVPMGR
jgi:HTH-type transcriptional regulator / antitoxin HipB